MRAPIILGYALAVLSLAGPSLGADAANAPASPPSFCSQTTVEINGSIPGSTPFIAYLDLTISPPGALKNIRFTIEPKPLSVTRPVSASYSSVYLQGRGYLDPLTGHLTLPVFGLYQDHNNQVRLSYDLNRCRSQDALAVVPTAPWVDPTGGSYTLPSIVQPRSGATDLSYDFIMLKGFAAPISPVIVDTDGEVRWVGTANLASIPAIFFNNGIYVSSGTGLTRMELDGTFAEVADYSSLGVTWTGHHNYDPGKNGILVEVNEVNAIESTILEVDRNGAVLKTWKIADIVRAAMIAGGDDPSAFVRAPDDWFHNNSSTYSKSGNALIVSGREDFVIALDYDTGNIKWILGDPTKAWYQYPSLRKYALTLVGDTHPPIGQHALSIAKDGGLLLFDNGRASLNQSPIGEDRTYSAPRKYLINPKKMTAQETWTHLESPSIYSPYCASVYEDERDNYLMNYTLNGAVMGFNAGGEKVFHYVYSTAYSCGISWNAIPIHLENVSYP
jgi:arylsulfate sulfotransferase